MLEFPIQIDFLNISDIFCYEVPFYSQKLSRHRIQMTYLYGDDGHIVFFEIS